MKVLYCTQVFEVGQDPGSERHFYFCRYLVQHGHSATAITSNVDYKQASVKYPGEGWHVRRQIEGVDVRYVYSYANIRGSFKKRVWYYFTYLCAALVAGLFVPKPDVIYAVSTPITVGLLGYLLSRLRRVPFVFEVTDVWPDAAVAVGLLKNKRLIQAIHWLEMFCYHKAAYIVALMDGIRNNIIGKGIAEDKVVLITNGVAASLFDRPPEAAAERIRMRKKLGFDEFIVCMYLGAHGVYNALWTIIDAAEALRQDRRFVFVLVGDGDDKPRLEKMVQERRLNNVRFLPPVPRVEAAPLLRTADVFLLPNRRGEFYTMNLPNKLFDFLASGRPIVVAGEGETGNVVQRAGAGYIVPAEDGRAMAEAIRNLAAQSDTARERMGESGRQYVFRHYNRDELSHLFLAVLERTIRHGTLGASQTADQHSSNCMMGEPCVIRPMGASDLEDLVQVHLQSFPGFFLTFLGRRFLELLYQNMQRDPDCVVLVAYSSKQIEGFVAGVTQQSGFYKRLVNKQKWAFAFAALGALLKRPHIAPRLFRALSQPDEVKQASAEACLMSIAVRPEAEGRGIGQQLVLAFCQELTERGIPKVCLTTDRDDNTRTNRFYQKLGFELCRSFVTPEGRAMNEYLAALPLPKEQYASKLPALFPAPVGIGRNR